MGCISVDLCHILLSQITLLSFPLHFHSINIFPSVYLMFFYALCCSIIQLIQFWTSYCLISLESTFVLHLPRHVPLATTLNIKPTYSFLSLPGVQSYQYDLPIFCAASGIDMSINRQPFSKNIFDQLFSVNSLKIQNQHSHAGSYLCLTLFLLLNLWMRLPYSRA